MEEIASTSLDMLIPHRAPARIIERAIEATENGARAELLVREGPWTRGGALAPEALVEALAQTAAVYGGARNLRDGLAIGARVGFLAAISHFAFEAPARIGERVELTVKLEKLLGEVAAFEGVATASGREVARGELRVAIVGP